MQPRGLIRLLASALLIAQALAHWPAAAARHRPDTDAISRGIQSFLEARSIPSAVVGIYDRDGLIWAQAFGLADRERNIPATVETPYQIGSITKLFTATLVMQLRDQRRLRLDDPMGYWFGRELGEAEQGEAISEITVRDLLTHTSGLPGNPVNRVDANGVMQPYSRAQLYQGWRTTRLTHTRGTRAAYSNLGYGILGHIVERVSGRNYEDVLRQHLLDPLGMRSTRIILSPQQEAALARHYWFQDPARQARHRWVFGEVAAFGGLVSTVPDLARFLSFHLRRSEGPVHEETLAEMQRAHARWIPGYEIGLGWQIWHSRGLGDILTHGGEVDGHGSYAAFSPGLGVGVVLLTNLGGPTASDLGGWLLAQVVARAREEQSPNAEQAARFSTAENWADAAWAWAKVTGADPANGTAFYQLGVAELNLDRFDRALAALARARELGFNPASTAFAAARAHAAMANRPAALASLREAVLHGFRGVTPLETFPEFQMLQSHPDWPEILARARRN